MSHFFCHLGALKCSDKVIDSLFHTKYLDTHTNEKIIILNQHCLVSSDLLEVYKDKASFFSAFSKLKIKQNYLSSNS